MSECLDHCLICGVSRAEVDAVRRRDHYTLGCGIESNTESGFDYDELSPRHRWSPWSDKDLARAGIKSEAFEKYRTADSMTLQYAACDDRVRGHVIVSEESAEFAGLRVGQCWDCGKQIEREASNE